MDINTYRVIVIPTAEREINRIYEYILKDLELEETAKNLMKRIEEIINTLKYAPHIFTKVERNYGLDMKYRRIVDLLHSRRFTTGGAKMKMKQIIAFMMGWIDESKILKRIDELAKSTQRTEQTVDSMQMVLATPRIYPYRFFTDPIELDFLGKKFYAPENYDPMLTEMYGDYMTPPPEEKRYNHNMHVYFRK